MISKHLLTTIARATTRIFQATSPADRAYLLTPGGLVQLKPKNTMLGLTATDKVTGLTGVVTARAEFLYGPTRYEVTPQKLHKGRPIEGQWHDADRWAPGKPAFSFVEPPCFVGLGDVVIDKLTEFKGVATGRFTFLNGCVRIEISPPKLKDGEPEKPCTVDLQQIGVVKAVTPAPPPAPKAAKKAPGGPHDGPPAYRTPSRH